MQVAYYEGEFIKEEEVKIPLSDRGFQFGDGAFATIQVKDGTPLFLESHLAQLKKQCSKFKLSMPQVSQETIRELISLNQATHGIWRLKVLITGGDGKEPHLPKRDGRVIIFIHPFTPDPFKALKMGLFSIPYSSCHASFKSLAHLNRFYVMEEAKSLGLDDCVTTTESGIILEAAFGNLFWVKEKSVMTPSEELSLYFGVTIKNILKIAEDLGFEIQYVKWSLEDLPQDAAAFRANTMQGLRPIVQIGKAHFGRHATLESLFIKGYEALIEQERMQWNACATKV